MTRVKRGVTAHARHKKILKNSKGYYGARSRSYRSAFQSFIKSGQYAYRDRKNKKRTLRRLWICRINASARKYGMSYSVFMHKIKQSSIYLDRKILSEIAIYDTKVFTNLCEKIKNSS
ncbi:MAG: 50S ribosomal protein L20 [Wigglesworthia glossinidia]|nr:50S ribosomal protein L20 [Wigglesworthia glossinidia]